MASFKTAEIGRYHDGHGFRKIHSTTLLAGADITCAGSGDHATAPTQASVGAPIEVGWQGGTDQRDFITIVPPNTKEGTYAAYQYANKNPVQRIDAGTYQLVVHSNPEHTESISIQMETLNTVNLP